MKSNNRSRLRPLEPLEHAVGWSQDSVSCKDTRLVAVACVTFHQFRSSIHLPPHLSPLVARIAGQIADALPRRNDAALE